LRASVSISSDAGPKVRATLLRTVATRLCRCPLSPHFKISAEELAWLGERVTVLTELVKAACEERLNALRGEG